MGVPAGWRPEWTTYLDSLASRPNPVSAVSFTTGQSVTPMSSADYAARERQRLEQVAASRAGHNRLVRVGQLATAAPFAVAGGAALLGGSAAGAAGSAGAASVPAAVGASAAPLGVGAVTAGAGGMTVGNLLKLGELGTGLFTNVIGSRQQNRALDRDALMRQNEFAAQMAMLQQQNEQARRQWEADQQQRANEYALALSDRNRRIKLDDEREARRTQYRTTIGDPALLRMRDLLRLGAR